MAKLFEENPDWTFGIETELKCKIESKSSVNFISILDPYGRETVRVFADMGTTCEDMQTIQRTIEIITNPIRIGDVQQHRKNMNIAGFFISIFKLSNNCTIKKESMITAFNNYIQNFPELYGYTCKVLWNKLNLINGIRDNGIAGNQITFGLPFSNLDKFFEQVHTPWYEPDKYHFIPKNNIENSRLNQSVYNYVYCMLLYLSEILNEHQDITYSTVKNLWGAMPRRAVTDLIRTYNIESLWQIIKTNFTNNVPAAFAKSRQTAYDLLKAGDTVGGHTKSIVTGFDSANDPQVMFEIRNPGGDCAEYFNFPDVNVPIEAEEPDYSTHFKIKTDSESEDESEADSDW